MFFFSLHQRHGKSISCIHLKSFLLQYYVPPALIHTGFSFPLYLLSTFSLFSIPQSAFNPEIFIFMETSVFFAGSWRCYTKSNVISFQMKTFLLHSFSKLMKSCVRHLTTLEILKWKGFSYENIKEEMINSG